MKLIAGLGNPGEKYKKSRHNFGFMVIERFLRDLTPVKKTVWDNQAKFRSNIAVIDWQPKEGIPERVILVKPTTYMNNSGMAVKLISLYYKIPAENIWVVNDDIDLPLGAMKMRFGGASAGHKGIESVIESLGTDKFWRLRMGIRSENREAGIKNQKVRNVEDYVLGNFTGPEKGKVKNLIKKGSRALQEALEEGLAAAMNRFNTR